MIHFQHKFLPRCMECRRGLHVAMRIPSVCQSVCQLRNLCSTDLTAPAAARGLAIFETSEFLDKRFFHLFYRVAWNADARSGDENSVRPFVSLSVCQTRGL